MVESSVFWLRAAAFLYAAGVLHSMLVVLGHSQRLYPAALGAFRIAVVFHAVAMVDLARAYGRLPLDNFYETLCLCAFLIALVFLMVEWRYHFSSTAVALKKWRYHFSSTAVALFPLVFVMTLVAALERPVASWPNVHVRDAWRVVHIVLVLAGYAALLLTAV